MVAQEVSAIAVSPTTARLATVGDTVRLVAKPTDANGYPVVNAAVDWRSDDERHLGQSLRTKGKYMIYILLTHVKDLPSANLVTDPG